MFEGCSALPSIYFGSINTSSVKDMSRMFSGCSSLTSLDLSSFNTGEVTDMSRMFSGCSRLETIYATEQFATDNVANSTDMFGGCVSLEGDIAYDATKTDKTYAILEDGYFSGTGGNTKPWVKYADGTLTFKYGTKTRLNDDEYWLNANKEEPGWKAHATDITRVVFTPSFAKARPTACYDWFYKQKNLTSIEGLEYLNTSAVTTMYGMFRECSSLESLDLSHFETANVTTMERMFRECSALKSLNLSKFETDNVTEMLSMFSFSHALTELNLSSFNTTKVKSMAYMFSQCQNLETIYVGHKFVTTGVTDNGEDMFYNCKKLKGAIEFDAAKVDKTYATCDGGYLTDIGIHPYVKYADGTLTFMYGAKTTLGADEYWLNEEKNAPGWQTAHAASITKVVFDPSFAVARPTSFAFWFHESKNLIDIEGIEYLNASKVTTAYYMFRNATALTKLDLSGLETPMLKNMHCMFYNCKALTSLDLSSLNTSNVDDMQHGISFCENLKDLYLGENFIIK